MGITFSKIGGAIKRAVSPKARAAHKAQQQQLDQIRKNIRANKAGENQEVTALINRVQDEVNLDEFTKLKSAPTHRPGTKKTTRAHSSSQDQFIKKFPSVPTHRPGNSST